MRNTDDGNALNRAHRRKFLLSGLLACGRCGGTYTIVGQDRYGCATLRTKGTCGNRQTIVRQRIEARVLSGLKERPLAPELMAEAVRVFADELAAAQKEATQKRTGLERQLTDIQRSLAGVLKSIEGGAVARSRSACGWPISKRGRRFSRLSWRPREDNTPLVVLNPTATDVYRQHVEGLEAALNDPQVRDEAAGVLRGLTARVGG